MTGIAIYATAALATGAWLKWAAVPIVFAFRIGQQAERLMRRVDPGCWPPRSGRRAQTAYRLGWEAGQRHAGHQPR